MNLFLRLYNYRELLKSNVKKEIRGKYKGSFLGVLWSFINPLLTVLVYAIVFPYILRVKQENYLIFLIVGVIPWNFFVTVIQQGTTTIMANENIIKKVFFPREILPISVAVSALINFFISCIIVAAFVIGSGIGIHHYVILLPVIAIIQFMLSLGIIFILSAINVYVRDTEYIVNFLTTMLFYGTPVLYSLSMFKGKMSRLLSLNPMTHIIEAYRSILYYQKWPDFNSLLLVSAFSFGVLLIRYFIFRNLEKGFAEEL